jgi:hypothetical protein
MPEGHVVKKHNHESGFNRRELLQRLAVGAGVSATVPGFGQAVAQHPAAHREEESAAPALGSAEPPDPTLTAEGWRPRFFDAHQNETVIVLSDLIIPDTETPGAKAALANRFIDLLLSASPMEEQEQFLRALGWLDGHCLEKYSRPFVQLDRTQRNEVLTLLTHPNDDPHLAYGMELFSILKSSIARAYYSSQIGSLQELQYETNPFQPEFPGCPDPEEHKSS